MNKAKYPVDIILPKTLFEPTKYRLLKPMCINGYIVPKDFITDGASVPRIFWSIFPPTGRYFLAAVLHDYLLDNGFCWRYANKEFKLALKSFNVNPVVTNILYFAVQIYQFTKHVIFQNPTNKCGD